MKTALIYTLFICLLFAFIEWKGINTQSRVKDAQIEALRADSVKMHLFFIEQSQKYEDFYNDYVNFEK